MLVLFQIYQALKRSKVLAVNGPFEEAMLFGIIRLEINIATFINMFPS